MPGCNRDRVAIATSRDYLGVNASRMVGADRTVKPVKGKRQDTRKRGPDWASGLKQLYDSVIDEPLPDAFKDLLSKLDDEQR